MANGSSLAVSLETGDGLAEYACRRLRHRDRRRGLNHSLTLSCEVRRLPPSVVWTSWWARRCSSRRACTRSTRRLTPFRIPLAIEEVNGASAFERFHAP